jgi:excisionase family DNA binding protein
MITAEKVYKEILNMPIKEREKLFTVIARKGFEKDSYSHNEVFADLRESPFTIKEAAEYLEVAEITLRRWIQSGLIPYDKVGRNFVFDTGDLKSFKRKRAKKP